LELILAVLGLPSDASEFLRDSESIRDSFTYRLFQHGGVTFRVRWPDVYEQIRQAAALFRVGVLPILAHEYQCIVGRAAGVATTSSCLEAGVRRL